MDTLWGLLTALLALGAARALFVRDDGPAAGYAPGDDFHRKMPAHKMYYIGGSNQKNMKLVNERAVDSYFRILRATPLVAPAPRERARSSPALPSEARAALFTERPARRHGYTRNDVTDAHRAELEQSTAAASRAAPRDELLRPSRHEYFRKHSVYEKHTVVSKGNKRNSRRPHRAQNFQQKMYLSQVRDKFLHKAGADEHAKEYSKRDAAERAEEPRPARVAAGALSVGRYTSGEAEAPYALFYRAGPELEPTLDARVALEEAPDGAYYRGSASSYVDVNIGRKASPVII